MAARVHLCSQPGRRLLWSRTGQPILPTVRRRYRFISPGSSLYTYGAARLEPKASSHMIDRIKGSCLNETRCVLWGMNWAWTPGLAGVPWH